MIALSLLETKMRRLKANIAALEFQFALRDWERALKAGYDPEQPRDAQGRWTSGGDGPTDEPGKVPVERPSNSRERYGIAKAVARWLGKWGGPIGRIVGAAYWLYEYDAYIKADLDPPASLRELQDAVSNPQRGYEVHHIVEQTSAERDGFPRTMIDGHDNLVRISTFKHREITAWQQTRSKEFGGLSPREYLQGRSWEERTRVGMQALVRFGALKP